MQRTASSGGNLHDHTGLEKLTRKTPEIWEYVDFSFYDWCWYKENAGMGEMKLGRWLGISHRTGSLMSFWILTPSCRVVSRTLVQQVTRIEMDEEATMKRTAALDESVKLRLCDHAHTLEETGKVEQFIGQHILSVMTWTSRRSLTTSPVIRKLTRMTTISPWILMIRI